MLKIHYDQISSVTLKDYGVIQIVFKYDFPFLRVVSYVSDIILIYDNLYLTMFQDKSVSVFYDDSLINEFISYFELNVKLAL